MLQANPPGAGLILILPEAWADMGATQRRLVEVEFGAKRSLLRRQIAELKAKFSDLDFENLVRATSSGAVSIMVRPPLSSYPWPWHNDESVCSGAVAPHVFQNFCSGAFAPRANANQYSDLCSRAFALQATARQMLNHAKQISSISHGSIHHVNGDESLEEASFLIDAAIPSFEHTVLQQASSKDSPAGSTDAPMSNDGDFYAYRAPTSTTPQSPSPLAIE